MKRRRVLTGLVTAGTVATPQSLARRATPHNRHVIHLGFEVIFLPKSSNSARAANSPQRTTSTGWNGWALLSSHYSCMPAIL
jgi:hypothetical protein